MPLYSVAGGALIQAGDVNQFVNVLTGVMTDQQVKLANGLAVTGGSVGIGTSSPTESLTIAAVTGYNTGLKLTGASVGIGVGMAIENVGASGHKFALYSSGGGGVAPVGAFAIYDDTATALRLIILPSGNIGIGGVTNPAEVLTIGGVPGYNTGLKLTGNTASAGIGMTIENTVASGHKWALFSSGGGGVAPVGAFALYDDTAGLLRLQIDGSGLTGMLRIAAGGHLVVTAATPTLGALQSGVASQSITGNDVRGTVTFTTVASGNSVPAGGYVANVQFGTAYPAVPVVLVTAANGSLTVYGVNNISTTGFYIYSQYGGSLPNSYTDKINYVVIG